MQAPSCDSQDVLWDTLSRLRVGHMSEDTEGPDYPLVFLLWYSREGRVCLLRAIMREALCFDS